MRVQLLPSHTGKPDTLQNLTTLLVNDSLAIDGGSLGLALDIEQMVSIEDVIVTHEHLDHIASLPLFVAEVFPRLSQPLRIHASGSTIQSLRDHIFNDRVWPRFHRMDLLQGGGKGLEFVEIEDGKLFRVCGLNVTPFSTNHNVPTLGVLLEDEHSSICFSSDTYRTDKLWEVANRCESLRVVLIDVSYPNELESLAEIARHLTPQALDDELKKLVRNDIEVLAVHLKPQYRDKIIQELGRLDRSNVGVVEIGKIYEW